MRHIRKVRLSIDLIKSHHKYEFPYLGKATRIQSGGFSKDYFPSSAHLLVKLLIRHAHGLGAPLARDAPSERYGRDFQVQRAYWRELTEREGLSTERHPLLYMFWVLLREHVR